MSPERRHLLLVGILPSLILLVIAAQLWLLTHGNTAARDHYTDHRYADARDGFRDARDFGVVETWVADFDAGTAAYRLGQFAQAATFFKRALPDAPDEHLCSVRIDLALTYEAIAETAATTKSRAAAQIALRDARDALGGSPCSTAILARINKKISALDRAVGTPRAGTELTEQEKLDRLEERNETARKTRDKPYDPETEPDVQIHW